MDAIRLGLMEARVNQLGAARPSSPLPVSRQDIADFHHDVFEQNGAGADAFGGDKWDRFLGGAGLQIYDWCPSPACRN